MIRKIVCGILAATSLMFDAFLVRADVATKKRIAPPHFERAMHLATTFCFSFDQISEVARLTLVGNSPEEALTNVNIHWRLNLCDRGWWLVWDPVLRKLHETSTHHVAIFKVETLAGPRYIFFALPRLKV